MTYFENVNIAHVFLGIKKSSICCYLVVLALIYATPGLAKKCKPPLPFSVQISKGIPNDGHLDNHHKIVKNDTHSYLYAMRTVAIMELLETRKALQKLMGAPEHLMNNHKNPGDLNFEVPAEVKRLYSKQHGHGVVEIESLINQVENTCYPYKPESREVDVLVLANQAASLVNIDRNIKFLADDLWHSEDHLLLDTIRRRLTDKYKLDTLLARHIGQRAHILNRYHILWVSIIKSPLYKQFYGILTKYGLPSPASFAFKVTPRISSFPDTFEIPAQFANSIDRGIQKILSDKLLRQKVFAELNPILEKAARAMLKENTKSLELLATAINFEDDKALFLELAKYSKLWRNTRRHYQDFLGSKLEYAKQQEILQAKNQKRSSVKSRLYWGTIIGSTALGVASYLVPKKIKQVSSSNVCISSATNILNSGLVAIKKQVASNMLSTSILAGTGALIFNSIDKNQLAEFSKNLFLASKNLGDVRYVEQTSLVAKESFQSMILGLIFLGAPGKLINVMSKVSEVVMIKGKPFIQLASSHMQRVKEILPSLGPRAQLLGAIGSTYFGNITALLVTFRQRLQNFEMLTNLYQQMVRAKTYNPKKFLDRLAEVPWIKNKLKIYVEPLKNAETKRVVTREILVNESILLLGESFIRGDEFFDEGVYVITNVVSMFILTYGIVLKSLANVKVQEMVFDAGLSMKQRSNVFFKKGKDLFEMSFWSQLVASGIVEGYDHMQNPQWETLGERAVRAIVGSVYCGLYIGTMTNIRSQFFFGWMEPKLLAQYATKTKTVQELMLSVSIANNAIGTTLWSYMMKYAPGGQSMGVDDVQRLFTPSSKVQQTSDEEDGEKLYLRIQNGTMSLF
ncbi:MAG: hypothetical protein ISR65_12370 [Bacteriovoracaceae bacterium]|nr:hypothetical protein [Bacteriovoracaceae bacterium]